MFTGTMWQWNSRRQRNQCVLWPNDMQGKLEKWGGKNNQFEFFLKSNCVHYYTNLYTETRALYSQTSLSQTWLDQEKLRYQRIWDIEFKIRTGNCGKSNLLRHIHGICPCLKYQIWTVHVSPQNKAVLHVL